MARIERLFAGQKVALPEKRRQWIVMQVERFLSYCRRRGEEMPDAVAVKMLAAGRHWARQWVFPSRQISTDPPTLSLCAHGIARFRLQTPGQRPGGQKRFPISSISAVE
jgi:hypothetical protein